jgi:hypothetical protein
VNHFFHGSHISGDPERAAVERTPFGLEGEKHLIAQMVAVENKVLTICDPKYRRVENTRGVKKGCAVSAR